MLLLFNSSLYKLWTHKDVNAISLPLVLDNRYLDKEQYKWISIDPIKCIFYLFFALKIASLPIAEKKRILAKYFQSFYMCSLYIEVEKIEDHEDQITPPILYKWPHNYDCSIV